MTRQVQRLGVTMLVLFGALFVQLNLLQVVRAGSYVDNQANRRTIIAEYEIERGPIVVNGREIAHSIETDDELAFLRVYEEPELYAHLTGWYSFVLQRSGLEQFVNRDLTGLPPDVVAQNLAELVSGRGRTGSTVQLTIDERTQRAARAALADRKGAIVALEPATGRVLASYSSPSYDPNRLSSHDGGAILEAWAELNADPSRPLLDRVTRSAIPPGSVFKLVVAAAAIERGIDPSTAFEDTPSYTPPGTDRAITNFSPGPCTEGPTITLADALRVSCNTVFARLGVELGPEVLLNTAEALGFNRQVPYALPVVASKIPKDLDLPATAQSAIGQRDVRVTPLHMAVLAAAIMNEGKLVRPYVVEQVLDPTGRVVRGSNAGPWVDGRFPSQAVTPNTAALLEDLMVQAVQSGTGTRAAIPERRVGGKTGTAQVPGETPTVWFVGFAENGANREVAVAVVLQDAGADATGGRDAAPIAKAIMETALGLR